MANKYWVGGTGNWNSTNTTNWSDTSGGSGGASLPAAGDNIIFNANSGSANYTVTFDGSWDLTPGDVTMSNPTGGVLTLVGSYANFYIGGNLTISSGVVTTGLVATFYNTVPVTATTNGVLLAYLVVNGTSTVTLGSALNVSNWTVYTGTFNSGNFNITASVFYGGNPGGSIRTVSLGSSTVTMTGGGTNAWRCQYGSADLTFNSGTSTINFTNAGAPYPEFHGGGKSYATVNVSGLGLIISENNTFSTLANTVSPATITFTSGSTQTFTNFNLSGSSASNLVTLNSTTAGTAATLSKSSGTVVCNYLSVRDSTVTGGASWNAANSTDVSNNTGWLWTNVLSTTSDNFFRMF